MKHLITYKIFENKELEDLEADIKEIFYDVLIDKKEYEEFDIVIKPTMVFKDHLVITILKREYRDYNIPGGVGIPIVQRCVSNYRAPFLFKEIKECVYRLKDFLKNRITSVYYFGYIEDETGNYPRKIYQPKGFYKVIDLKDFFNEKVILFPQLFNGNDNPINEFAIVIRK